MKIIIPALIILTLIGCSPVQQETSQDSTALPVDSTTADNIQSTESDDLGEEYVIEDGFSYLQDPLDFTLDSASVQKLLGAGTTISVTRTPADEEEETEADSFYEVTAPGATLSFHSPSSKYSMDIATPKVPFKNGVVIGMTKSDFIKAMNLSADASKANAFGIYGDHGSMSFEFANEKLDHIYITN